MELIIHTKYAIGQEVYLKKTALDGKQESIREDKIFSSLEEVEAHCKHDS